jgi:hypothetical protein
MPHSAHDGDGLGCMVLGLRGQGVFAHRKTDEELALRVGCDPNCESDRLAGRTRFHLSALQDLAILVQDAARKHDPGWHNEIAEISNIAGHKQEWFASQGQLVSR